MQPFSIHCESCSARLKVKNATAIGQRLACPKCGVMVLVEPPEDWIFPESSVSSDLGHLGDAPAGDTNVAAGEGADRPADNDQTTPANVTQNEDTRQAKPLLPGEQWTSSATQQKRKWLLLTAGLVTILALATAVVFAVLANWNKGADEQPVATREPIQPQPVQTDGVADPPDADPLDASSIENPVDEPPGDETPGDSQNESDDGPGTKPEQPDFETDPGTQPQEVQVPPPPVEDSAEPSESNSQDASEPESGNDEPEFGASFDDLLNETNIVPGGVETNFGELSDALANAGATLSEFGQIAAVNERGRVGRKKYFVFQPDPLDPKNYSGLNLPVEGVQYNDHSLLTVLADFFQITGVPVTLDADLLDDAGFNFGYRTNQFKLTRTTFAKVLRQLLDEMNGVGGGKFVLQYDGDSPATITIADRNQRPSVRLPMPKIPDDNDAARQELVDLIKHLTGSDQWDAVNGDASLQFEDDGLVVVNRAKVVSLVGKFVANWNNAVAVTAGQADRELLQPVWTRSQASRETAFQWSARHDTPILQFLAAVQHATQVNIIVNWQQLQDLGWNPRTEVPPDLDEATVGDLLDELTHSMGLAYRVVNPNTFEITTIDDVNDRPQLEFFSCHAILAGGDLDQQQLVDIVRTALRSTGQNLSAWRVVFEPSIQCFIAVGPQTLHRQINAILNRVENL